MFLRGYSDNVLDEIKDASVYVMSSDYEGMSNSLMEAMAIGLPVVSTDHPIGGARILINDGQNGMLVAVGDAENFANSINAILDDSNLSNKLTSDVLRIREYFSLSIVANLWFSYMRIIR